jgi:hypothetical protein
MTWRARPGGDLPLSAGAPDPGAAAPDRGGARKGGAGPSSGILGRPIAVTSNPSSTLSVRPGPALSAGPDPDLLSLPAPPRRERTATVMMMLVTTVAALWMATALLGEARYALTQGQPLDVGDLGATRADEALANRYIRGSALLGTTGAIRYGRAAEGDSFRLAPVAGNPSVWIEIRVPEGFEGPRFVPPTSFAGRLVPFDHAGVRHGGLARAVREQTETTVPQGAWMLIDGSSPRTSRWAVALTLLFVGFAAWNVAGAIRLLSRVNDREGAPPKEPGALPDQDA